MIPYVIVSIIFAIVVSLINIYCLVIIVRSRKLHNPPQMCIFSLLLGHALQGLITIPCYAAKRQGIYKNTAVCDIFRFSYLLTNYWCCLSILVISIDRFIGVIYPLHYKSWVTCSRMRKTFICIWLYVFLLCLIPFAPSTKKGCKYNPQTEWVITMLLMNTLLPFIIITVLYILILRRINNARRDLQKRSTMERGTKARHPVEVRKASTREFRRTKITFFIVGTYIICWGPSLFYYLLLNFCSDTCFRENYNNSTLEEIVGFLIKFLTFVDGAIAPLVYCWINKSFQQLRRRVLSSVYRMFFRKPLCRLERGPAVLETQRNVFDSGYQPESPKISLGVDVLNNVRTISSVTLIEDLDKQNTTGRGGDENGGRIEYDLPTKDSKCDIQAAVITFV